MKIAVLSDVHGNLPALEAVLDDIAEWQPDQVIVNGDLVNRGPNSLACVRLLTTAFPEVAVVQGNHEEFVLECMGEDWTPGEFMYDMRRFGHFTLAQLGDEVERVAAWPHHLDLIELEGGSVHVTHGSVLGKREGILPTTEGEELRSKLGDPRDLFIAAHTHRPMVREFDGTLVVNVGSTGAPFDRDPRSAYGRMTFRGGQWHAEIRRVHFDRERAEREFAESGFLDEGGPLARVMLAELRQCRGLMGPWMRRFFPAVKAGEMTVSEAVDRHLQIEGDGSGTHISLS